MISLQSSTRIQNNALVLFVLTWILTVTQVSAQGAFTTKKYRNLFYENGHSRKEIQIKIDKAFKQLFQGNAKQAIYFPAGKNKNGRFSYILDVLNKDIRSEGMSYGMMVSVQMNKKAEFDALWNYAMTKMYIRQEGHPGKGYFAWSLKQDGTPNAAGPAPDGEEYFVTALYFASGRWGNGRGIYNYSAWADKILSNMRHHPVSNGPTKFGNQTIGSMVNEDHKMIIFVPGGFGLSFSDPSYHLPAFYEIWARYGPKADRQFWSAAADSSRNYFQKSANLNTGLAADYADFSGKPIVTKFNANSGNFAYDSWRTVMNWSVDWSWWQKDNRQPARSNTIQAFFANQGLRTYGNIYTLEGKRISSDHSAGLVASNAVASLAATHPLAKDFVEELWKLKIPESDGERYYGGLLYLMSLLHCSGQFQVYTPR
jgi:oligosaccharide reducing-end xylanase